MKPLFVFHNFSITAGVTYWQNVDPDDILNNNLWHLVAFPVEYNARGVIMDALRR